jgi:hypothetical protein
MYHSIVETSLSLKLIEGDQPNCLILVTSNTFLGVPLGLEVSQTISPE